MADLNLQADVLIVTVAKVESHAVMRVFREATGKDATPVRISDRIYHDLGEVNGDRVFMALSEMGSGGLGASQQAVQKGIAALRPAAVIMVGIAFGVNQQKQVIGDILVSQQLWLYDLQRLGKDQIIPRGDKPHASPWLFDFLRGADLYWTGATVRTGLVLTGEKLLDNVDYRDQLIQFEAEAIGGEMEGAGLYVACQDAHVDWILVKAICDWADGNKAQDKDARQHMAADNAASFVLYALQQASLKREREAYAQVESLPKMSSAEASGILPHLEIDAISGTQTKKAERKEVQAKVSSNRMKKVFLSHRGADTNEATKVAEALRSAGHTVLFDRWDLHVGDSIIAWMNHALSVADCMVLCLSQHGEGPFMSREWQAFLHRQLSTGNVRVLPIRLTGGNLPPVIGDYLLADAVADFDAAIKKLLDALES